MEAYWEMVRFAEAFWFPAVIVGCFASMLLMAHYENNKSSPEL